MKKHLLLPALFLLFLDAFLVAQIACPVVLASAGHTVSVAANDVRANFTVGETVVVTFDLPGQNVSLGQGFHSQDCGIMVAVDDPVFADWQLKIYPNPASELLFVESGASAPSPRFLMATVFDWLGRMVLAARPIDGFSENSLPLGGLAAGPYLLRLTDETGRAVSISFVCSH